MNSTINQRIREIIEDSGKTITSYASIIGVSQPTLKACVDGSNKPSYDTIQKILISNPMISAEWLLRSEGEKYKQNIQNKAGESCKNTVKIVVELEISKGEFDDMGLKDKVIQALGK